LALDLHAKEINNLSCENIFTIFRADLCSRKSLLSWSK